MAFKLPALKFDPGALAPALSAESFSFHHGKHHQAYITVANEIVAATPALQGKSIEEVTKIAAADPALKKLFNNAGQHFNHSLYWLSLANPGTVKPSAAIAKLIDASFGDFAGFKTAFVNAGIGQFGSGWVWLVADGDKLAITTTGNAETPLTAGKNTLAVCDVWEHAYYIDYRNNRKGFIETFVDQLIDWSFVEQRLEAPGQSLDTGA
jgi:Fe-Mn family superoxide dismutase